MKRGFRGSNQGSTNTASRHRVSRGRSASAKSSGFRGIVGHGGTVQAGGGRSLNRAAGVMTSATSVAGVVIEIP